MHLRLALQFSVIPLVFPTELVETDRMTTQDIDTSPAAVKRSRDGVRLLAGVAVAIAATCALPMVAVLLAALSADGLAQSKLKGFGRTVQIDVLEGFMSAEHIVIDRGTTVIWHNATDKAVNIVFGIGEKVNGLMEDNAKMLKIAIEANRRVVNLIAEAVKASVPSAGTYSPTGGTGTHDHRGAPKNVALSVDHTL